MNKLDALAAWALLSALMAIPAFLGVSLLVGRAAGWGKRRTMVVAVLLSAGWSFIFFSTRHG
jgi:Kef-type K+ transport system membrane component KefB